MQSPLNLIPIAFLLLAFCSLPSKADEVDNYITSQLTERHVPGISLAVIQNGKIVKSAGYGLASIELKVPATADTVYEIGSITKQFTSCLVMMAVETGNVGLDEHVSKYLDNLPDAWKDVTIRHLLTHTSGIKGYTELPDFAARMVNPASHDDVVKSVANLPLEFKPGEKWQYSNTGYFLLGMVLEKVTGKPYSELLNKSIFEPLLMSSTRVNNPLEIVPDRANGYQFADDKLHNAQSISMDWPFSAGALLSTVNDLAKWDAALAAGKLLKPQSWAQVLSPVRLNDGTFHPYGFGWSVAKLNDHTNYAHGGGIPGFTTYISRFPDDKLTVILLCNQMVDTTELANHVAGLYVSALIPPPLVAIEDKDPKITAEVKSIIEQAADGKVDASLFTKELGDAFLKSLQQDGTAQLKALGAIESIALVERKEQDNAKIFRYRVAYKQMKLIAVCNFDKDGKLSAFGMRPEK